MPQQSDKVSTVFTGVSDVAVSRIMHPVHGGMKLDEQKAAVVILEALGRLDRELRKAGVTGTNVMLHVVAEVEVQV